jgi:predicted membrane chloride channel (bestrophin family)
MATRDEKILSAVRRYSRASLMIIFLKRRHGAQELKSRLGSLSDWGVLTEDEVEKLRAYNNNLAESIWTWNVNIVTQLYQQGLIKTEWQYTYILDRAMLGRSGAALIGAQMGTPIPFQYVHLLSFLVKLHNLMLAVVFGAFWGYDLGTGNAHELASFQVIGRVMLVPFLYNSLLIINETLADPFGNDINDFPMTKYEKGIESDGASYVEAGAHLPGLLSSKRKLEGV